MERQLTEEGGAQEGQPPALPKVLVVDDHDLIEDLCGVMLHGKIKLVRARTLEEGWSRFQENSDVALVVMDACVPGTKPNSMPLARAIREAFKGPMIAASSDPGYSAMLLVAGCDVAAQKYEVPEVISRHLKLG